MPNDERLKTIRDAVNKVQNTELDLNLVNFDDISEKDNDGLVNATNEWLDD